tara:strand:+ start:34395 stop:35108 length:714 start_codon:yes stop_codon:yes gene_type:complete
MIIRFITLTNKGYTEFTLNLLLSFENANIQEQLTVYCIDDYSYNFFQKKGYFVEKVEHSFNESLNDISKWRSYQFNKIMFLKLSIIYQNLKKFQKVLFIDGDIFIKKDFFKAINEYPDNYDILAQLDNDANSDSPIKTLCAGLMLINSNKTTLKLFNPKKISYFKKRRKNFLFDDQKHINLNIHKLNVKFLDPKLFPNGSYFYKNYETINPLLIHFNWIENDEKKELMNKFNCWLVK